jgi:putative oxidoreductase
MPVRLRDRVGLNVPPLFLRLMLGIVFVYAGFGKVSQPMVVSGQQAADLANMGVIVPPAAIPETLKPPETKAPEAKPPETRPTEAKPPEPKPAAPTGPTGALDPHRGSIVPVRWQGGLKIYTAADFPSPVQVKLLYSLALMLRSDAAPEAGKMPLWPPPLGAGETPVYLAWAVAVTELGGGVCLLLGLLTRVSALGIAAVMLGAMWLTEFGPAIQKGDTVLGFLPNRPVFDMGWQTLMLQFSLLASALALAFCGPGRLSLDRALLSGRGEDDDED